LSGEGQVAVLDVHDLNVGYRTAQGARHVVRDVSLQVPAGSVLGVVGESGSGKSTLIRAIGQVLPANATVSSGEVRYRGTDLLGEPPAAVAELMGAKISMIFQDPVGALNPMLTVGQHMDQTLRTHRGLHGSAARSEATTLLDYVGIAEPEKALRCYPNELSGGMSQRVCIALAISSHPDLLLADEPTAALDATVAAQIVELLDRLRHELGMAIVLVTHSFGVIGALADTVCVMYGGRVVEFGSVSEVLSDPGHPYSGALIESIVRIDDEPADGFTALPGVPPDLSRPEDGCNFRPRCAYRIPICARRNPALRQVSDAPPHHLAACWLSIPAADRAVAAT
jgi:oligopeptide/dipeptide ABC transporter ATP-binding protein